MKAMLLLLAMILGQSPDAVLIRQMGDDLFSVREDAFLKLKKRGVLAWPALKQGLKDRDPEIRHRSALLVDEIMRPMTKEFSPKILSSSVAIRLKHDEKAIDFFMGTIVKSDDKSTHILTCAYVIYDPIQSLDVLIDGKEYKVTSRHMNNELQLSLLTIDKGGLLAAKLGKGEPKGFLVQPSLDESLKLVPRYGLAMTKKEGRPDFMMEFKPTDAGTGLYNIEDLELVLTGLVWGRNGCTITRANIESYLKEQKIR